MMKEIEFAKRFVLSKSNVADLTPSGELIISGWYSVLSVPVRWQFLYAIRINEIARVGHVWGESRRRFFRRREIIVCSATEANSPLVTDRGLEHGLGIHVPLDNAHLERGSRWGATDGSGHWVAVLLSGMRRVYYLEDLPDNGKGAKFASEFNDAVRRILHERD
jgi:hypothetical protein